LRLVLLKEIPEDAELRRQWHALVLREERPQVFYTYEWALAVYRAYHASLRPLLFLAYDAQNSLCGVGALAIDPSSQRVSFLGATTGDYCDFLGTADEKPALVAAVLAELRKQGLGEVTLTNLPADSSTVAALRRASAENGYWFFARTAYVCAQVSLRRLERTNDGKRVAPGQKRVRRFAKAMGPEAPVRLDHSRSWDALAPILPQFIQAHVGRFLEIGRVSNLANERRQAFLVELAKLLSTPGWLVLSRMRAGERVVAWHYGFQFHGSWFWYQPTFDSSVEKHWPGFCLLTQVIQEATDDPTMTTLDLGLGSEAYKAKFANESRETLHFALHRSVLKHLGTVLRYRTAEAVRSHPTAEKVVGWLRTRLQALRSRLKKQGMRQTVVWAARRLLGLLWERQEVIFYEWEGYEPKFANVSTAPNVKLRPLDLNKLAAAAMEYEDDEATLVYLLRSTQRLRRGGAEGFVLSREEEEGRILHFAWTAAFDGFFLAELKDQVEAPTTDCVLIFDCWTPAAAAGRGYYAQAVELVADLVKRRGQRPWIFSAAGNVASIRGLEKTGFQRRYSLVRQRLLGWQWIKGQTPKSQRVAQDPIAAESEDSAA
jgi:CelD/BcsL family acetyltransferase involved in cellulose biosynthesis